MQSPPPHTHTPTPRRDGSALPARHRRCRGPSAPGTATGDMRRGGMRKPRIPPAPCHPSPSHDPELRRRRPGSPACPPGREGNAGAAGGIPSLRAAGEPGGDVLTSWTSPGAAAWVRAARPGRAAGGRSGREAADGSWGGEGRSPGPHWRVRHRRGAQRRPGAVRR